MPASPLLVCPDSKMNTFAAIKPDVVLWHAVPDATWALVPVKAFAKAKQRLSNHLTPPRRIAFARAMMEKVIRQLQATPILAGVAVVTGDEEVAAFARLLGTRVLIENRPVSLTSAVAYGTCSLFDEGADAVLVLPADLPFIHSQDLIALLACRDDAAVTIVPSRDGTGTNALLVTAACPELFAFGSDSASRHRARAAAAGLSVQIRNFWSLAFDVDTPEDLREAIAGELDTTIRSAIEINIEPNSLISRSQENSPNLLLDRRHVAQLSEAECLALERADDLDPLMTAAAALRDSAHPNLITYSRKVFIPLTHLCRNVCHYCVFARPPRAGQRAFMSMDDVIAIAKAGAAAGCREALFTLGDKPELRYDAARIELKELGFETTLDYLREAAATVTRETGLLPHLNPGVLDAADFAALRPVSVSMGLMLESVSERLCQKGQPHYGSPDKRPSLRLATIAAAGAAQVPFTSGILIGIGETRRERIEALLALRALNDRYGHLQEVIIQNFRAKPGTRMAFVEDASETELLWTIAIARLILGAEANIQAPPNLAPGAIERLMAAGINDWGGVSPVTADHVNPERPWPRAEELAVRSAAAGKQLAPRLAIYPSFAAHHQKWIDQAMVKPLLNAIDSQGLARIEAWRAGTSTNSPTRPSSPVPLRSGHNLEPILASAMRGQALDEDEIVRLFSARGEDLTAVIAAADELRRESVGEIVTYVVNRNINYTNVCTYGCRFCAFSKGRQSAKLRGAAYDLDHHEIARRVKEAWARGAVEVCMQGGIHPSYSGHTYVDILRTVKRSVPDMHVHAFSPLEIWQGAQTLDMTIKDYLARLHDEGLGTLPGTAAEILDDEIRRIICPDKLTTELWLDIMATAHSVGLRSTATIMYGHVERPIHWARHLLRVRRLQERTGGFTEFVPLPFVADEAPIYLKGQARPGPTYNEAVAMHAVSRLALHPVISNIQASWVKMGTSGAADCLRSGANDLGGTLMNESISRAAGASHGQELPPKAIEDLIRGIGRVPSQRNTLYRGVPSERTSASFTAPAIEPLVATPLTRQRNGIASSRN
jgi:FO synthase